MNNIYADDLNIEKIQDELCFEKEVFLLVTDVISDTLLDIRYYHTLNFVGERIDSYEAKEKLYEENTKAKK